MQATLFERPDGRRQPINVVDIDPADEAWFVANNAKISLEEEEDGYPGAPNFIVYADIGLVTEDGEPDEVIEFSLGRPCSETLAALRRACEERKAAERAGSGDCAAGLHSWIHETGRLAPDTKCTRCGELYGNPK